MTMYARRTKLHNSSLVRLVSVALCGLWFAVVTAFAVASLSGCDDRGFDCFGKAGVGCRPDAGRDSSVADAHPVYPDAGRHDAPAPDMHPPDTGVDYRHLHDAAVPDGNPHDGWRVLFTLRTTITAPDTFFARTRTISGAEFRWDFGDGTVVDGESAIHKYTVAGEKVVRLLSDQVAGGMTSLDLGSNGIVGDPIAGFGEIATLGFLDLSDNHLAHVSSGIGKLSGLYRLDLSNNGLQGMVPPQIRELKEIDRLYLADNPFTQYSSGTFSGLKELCTLDLKQNQLDQTALNAIIDDIYQDRESNVCGLPRTLDLRGATAVSPSPAALDKLAELRESYFWRVYCHGC